MSSYIKIPAWGRKSYFLSLLQLTHYSLVTNQNHLENTLKVQSVNKSYYANQAYPENNTEPTNHYPKQDSP
jgi:hypothetical protein